MQWCPVNIDVATLPADGLLGKQWMSRKKIFQHPQTRSSRV